MLLPSHIKLLQIAKVTYTYRHIFDLLFLSFSFLILKHSNTCFAINFWGSSFSLGGFIKNKNFVHSYKMFIFQVIQLKHFFFPGKRGIQLKSDIHPPSRVYKLDRLILSSDFL